MSRAHKRLLENTVEAEILANPSGIDTRVMMGNVLKTLQNTIPNLNLHNISGMFSWVYKSYNHTFLKRTPGSSIVA